MDTDGENCRAEGWQTTDRGENVEVKKLQCLYSARAGPDMVLSRSYQEARTEVACPLMEVEVLLDAVQGRGDVDCH